MTVDLNLVTKACYPVLQYIINSNEDGIAAFILGPLHVLHAETEHLRRKELSKSSSQIPQFCEKSKAEKSYVDGWPTPLVRAEMQVERIHFS